MTQSTKDLVESINTYLQVRRGTFEIEDKSFLVFGATITPNIKFKAYKTVTYKVVLVRPGSKNIEIYSDSETGNFSAASSEKGVYKKLNSNAALFLLEQIRDTDKFNNLLTGRE